MRKGLITIFVLMSSFLSYARIGEIDSLKQLLSTEKVDSNKVRYLWNMAAAYQIYKPDTSMRLAEQALSLSRKINYPEGESKSLNQLANAFNRVGNFSKALDYYIQKLRIDEKRKDQRDLASSYINIATAYSQQGEYAKALSYAILADSLIIYKKIKGLRFYNLLNIGDIYEKYNKLDSALRFTNRAYEVAVKSGNENHIGASLTNMANICLKNGSTDLAILNYRKGLPYLERTNDEEFICENALGFARAFQKKGIMDSSLFYARKSYNIAVKDGFLSRVLEASIFLKDYFKNKNIIDSAYQYQEQMILIKDTINSSQRIRAAQIISMDEQQRQKELNELRMQDKAETNKRLQFLGIGVLIPLIFLLWMYYTRQKVKPRRVEILGVVSLLLLFECISLLLHPFVVEMTFHIPILELLVFAVIATLLSRTHHKFEKWVVSHLTHQKQQQPQEIIV
ncbi:MAG: tetratricopeptide repeat protein [Segetibacter sp.]|nr:tetratricopeptide repeat protein [Segetibacter sp.]